MAIVKAAYLISAAILVYVLWVPGAEAGNSSVLTPGFRPPSVPLVVVDPYLRSVHSLHGPALIGKGLRRENAIVQYSAGISLVFVAHVYDDLGQYKGVWSNADHLYDDLTRHWTGIVVSLLGMISIDGKPYGFMGMDTNLGIKNMQQVNVMVFPTQTTYVFQQDGVQLTLTFSTPAYAPYLYYFPVTFLTYNVSVIDGMNHTVQLYYDNTAEGAVSDVLEMVVWNRAKVPGHVTMRIGTEAQKYLGQDSDMIDWGYWYVDVVNDSSLLTTMANSSNARTAFTSGQPLPPDDENQPRPCSDGWPVLAVVWDLGTIQPKTNVSKYLVIAYDQVYSISYFGTPMIPLWKNEYYSMENLLGKVDRTKLQDLMNTVDDNITSKLYVKGGSNYTTISSLAWRQATGGTIAVYNNVTEEIWMFMKEISSDGDVSTVDVVYPASPLFLWSFNSEFSPMKLIILPILNYANNKTAMYGLNIPYNLPWAPHHLGHWPICNIPPNEQEQMPMEETANLLAMLAYLVQRDGDISFLEPYWPLLEIWGKYLHSTLPDPGNQLCTDDFEGPSPHNVNLAAKGIVGLASYAYLLQKRGNTTDAEYYDELCKAYVTYWLYHASDGDHYRLQYNVSNSWSLKYNLLFQKVMQFNLFPQSVFDMEEQYYQAKMNAYGVPLDNRNDYTKTDWQMWVAAMGTQQQFQSFVDHVYKFANETPDRVPFTDWYFSTTGRIKGFRARPVIGGLYARMLV